jgi:hypothetical protein
VLRPWGKPATIALAPEGIAFRPAGAPAADIRLLASQQTARSWDGRLTELSGMASELDVRRVRFILSSQYVRYAVLPWQEGIYSGQDWQALGEHHFRKMFGGIAETWEVRVALQGYGESVVICAIDRSLLSGIKEIAAQFHWAVHGIEPALMAVFNRHRREMTQEDYLLMLAEPQRLVLAEVAEGKWRRFAVASPPAGQEGQESVGMIERALMEQGSRDQGTAKPAEVFTFGHLALLPAQLRDDIRMMRLPQPAGASAATSLSMLASL